MALSPTQRLVLVTAVVAAAATAVIAVSSARFVYSNAEARVALETAQGLVALLAAWLVAGQFRRTADRRDLLVVAGLAVLGVIDLLLAILPAIDTAISEQTLRALGRWTPLTGQLLGAAAIAAAALLPSAKVRWARPLSRAVGGAVIVLAVVGAAMVLADDHLPRAVDPIDLRESGARPHFDAHPLLIGAQAALVLLFAWAAWAFARRASDPADDDVLVRALAIGSVLAAASRLCFLLYPSNLIALVHVGDLFRLGFYVVLAGGAAVRIQRYWSAEAEAAELHARERVAREIHDGLTQELGFIASHATSLASGRGDPELVDHLAMAAQRAQNESRRIIDALEGAAPRRLVMVLQQALTPVADRHGATVTIDIDPALALDPRITHEISQIAREATANAVRHGAATTIAVQAGVVDGEVRLTLADDGTGFDRGGVDRSGFGLRSMEQRAIQLGGTLVIRSTLGSGTSVELVVPETGERDVRWARPDVRSRSNG